MRFKGKTCLVTGGGSGIGRATCKGFAAEGANVVLVDVDQINGDTTVAQITEAGGQALFIRADVSVSTDVQTAIGSGVSAWGRLDVLVNNAAVMTFDPICRLDEEAWERVMAVNLRSVFLFCKYALPHMPPGSSIVNVSSVHAHETTANVVPYATTKGGIEAFTRGLSRELEAAGVRVNCVDPGAVDTPMLWANPKVQSGAEQIAGALGKPEDIGAAILFLASGEARFINGTSLAVDGGRLSTL